MLAVNETGAQELREPTQEQMGTAPGRRPSRKRQPGCAAEEVPQEDQFTCGARTREPLPLVAALKAELTRQGVKLEKRNQREKRMTQKVEETQAPGEDGQASQEDKEEIEMLTTQTPRFQKVFCRGKKETSLATVQQDKKGRDRSTMCANTDDFKRVRELPFEEDADLSKRHEALILRDTQLAGFPGLLAAVAQQNKTIAEKITEGHHELLPCYISNWRDAWLLLLTDFGIANMKQYCMDCMWRRTQNSSGLSAEAWCSQEGHTGQRFFFRYSAVWRDKTKWSKVAQQYKYYSEVFKRGQSEKQAALLFLQLGIPLAPTIVSPVCYQYDALKEPEWVHAFFEADVAEMKARHGEEITVEEYRVRLARSFAKAPVTKEDKKAWAAFKAQYTKLEKTVARAKEAKRKADAKDKGEKGGQKTQQTTRKVASRGQGGRSSTLAVLADAAGEAQLGTGLFGKEDGNIDIRGGGSERDTEAKRKREAVTAGTEAGQPGEEAEGDDRDMATCHLCEKENSMSTSCALYTVGYALYGSGTRNSFLPSAACYEAKRKREAVAAEAEAGQPEEEAKDEGDMTTCHLCGRENCFGSMSTSCAHLQST